jgi:hypothetical protein
MPGTFATVYLVAFDLDDRNQAVQAFAPRAVADEASAIQEAGVLARRHTGVVVWRRDNNPVIGEEGDPELVFSVGTVGDFA